MKTEQPPSQMTLTDAREAGLLSPLDRGRVRAQLGMLDSFSANDVRRATALMLARLMDYYAVVQYTGPGYVYGRTDSTYASALNSVAAHNYIDGSWSYREMGPTHAACTVQSLFDEAGWLCIPTACKLIAAEMACEAPEATEVLRQAGYCVDSLFAERSVSGVNWSESRRRLGTPGIRKLLVRILSALPNVQIGLGPIRPVVLSKDQLWMAEKCRNVREWSAPSIAA